MPDHSLPDDELLSSYLDGELTVDEVALVDRRLTSEPALRRRLDALRAADELAATPVVPLSTADADRMIAAALSAGAGATAENVTDLAAASARRDRLWPTRLASLAAGVVALAITASVVVSLGADDDADTADAGDSATSADMDTADFADDGDTGGDLSFESMPSTAAAEMAEGDADSAGDDSAGDDSADEGAVTDDAEAPFAPEDARANRAFTDALAFGLVDGFAPLPDDLGDFATRGDLDDAISLSWDVFRTSPPPSSTTDTSNDGDTVEAGDQVLTDLAAARLAELGLGDCVDLAGAIGAEVDAAIGSAVIMAVDLATATLDGAALVGGVIQLSDGRAVALIIDPDTCAVAAQPLE
ncbi:MAG: hypothetical protein RIB98_11310 [Acidimicrobiales bacterium]